MTKFKSMVVITAVVSLLFVACGAGSETGSSGEIRAVRISALDTLRFEPDAVRVSLGETVRFVVTNEGEIDHEFILGDEAMQDAHEMQMTDGEHMEMDAMAALELAPGETKETTVTLDQAGTILFGCHLPGHYQAGMVGSIEVG